MRFRLALAAAGLALAACRQKESTEITKLSRPWERTLAADSLRVNAALVALTSASGSKTRLVTAVPTTSLPDPLRTFDINVLMPTDVGYSLLVNDLAVVVRRTDGTQTTNVLHATRTRFIGARVIGGQRFSEFRIAGDLTTTGDVARAAFTAVAFSYSVTYEDPTGDAVHTQSSQVEVEKQP